MAEFLKELQGGKAKAVADRVKKDKALATAKLATKTGAFAFPIHHATKANSLETVNALLATTADVNALDSSGDTALHIAAALGDAPGDAVAITAALVKKKAKTDVLNKAGLSPWHVAAAAGAAAIIGELAAAPGAAGLEAAATSGDKHTPLLAALLTGKHAAVAALVQAGAKLSTPDASTGATPLMRLLAAGKVGDAQRLLELGDCNVNAQGTADPFKGLTVLLMVVPGSPTCNPETPGAAALIATLLDKGASVDVQAPGSQETPLMWAIAKKDKALVAQLLKKSKQLGLKNKAGRSALDLAIAAGDLDDVVAALIGAGVDVGADGPRLLQAALDAKKDAVLAELVKVVKQAQLQAAKLDFQSLSQQGLPQSALAYLTRFDKAKATDAQVDSDGNTLLHSIAESGAGYDLVAGLIQLGLGANTANGSGDTPLHVAARAGHVDVCRALVDGGADPLKRNGKNRRPREQPKIPDCTKDYLLLAEDQAKEKKANKQSELWDDKIKATQTESAFGLRCL